MSQPSIASNHEGPPADGAIAAGIPLFVDLDGTLIAGDVTHESVLASIKRDPAMLFRIPVLALRGRAVMKRELAGRVMPDVRVLPYRHDVLNYLREQRSEGRRVILATASDRRYADAIAKELGLFDDVIATDGELNLKGPNKLRAIRDYCTRHGFSQFAYAGDAPADIPIWREAAEVHVVAPSPMVRAMTARLDKPVHLHCERKGVWKAALRAMRPHQWVKNLLIFVPLVLGHHLQDTSKVVASILAFIAFSACASAVYVLNDMMDIEADRHHPTKRNRPFASGQLPILYGPVLTAGLMLFAVAVSLIALPLPFLGMLGIYVLVNLFYSFWLKRKLVLDVMLLAGMYALRVLVGGVAADVVVSEWLLAFSMFLFTSLAFGKRHAELARHADEESEDSPRGRGYGVGDLSIIESIGPTAGYMAVLVLALYINSPEMKVLYTRPWALWLICPLMLYWVTRIWFIVKRGELDEDPVVFALRDRVSLGIGLLVVLLAAIATRA